MLVLASYFYLSLLYIILYTRRRGGYNKQICGAKHKLHWVPYIAERKEVHGLGPSEAPAPANTLSQPWRLTAPFKEGARQDDEERGGSKIRRMPLRAGSGRVHSLQICGQPQNGGAVTGERGQMAASLSSYFSRLQLGLPASGGETRTRGGYKEED